MRYYLDTNMLLFILSENKDDISIPVAGILSDYSNQFFTSSVCITELIFLHKNGKVKFKRYKSELDILRELTDTYGIDTVYFNRYHLAVYTNLKIIEGHKDPNDHAIIAQAISDKIPLISSDTKFKDYISQNLDFVFNKR
ncbi:hypothetical protein FACS189421_04880 [Bacteroidia bacterium]|nr:hypothetical protein FACS189421_04880 [Bacteroidia bacterium]GHT02902.1 hypothetical protein FACS189423_02550 [Bacteroidia bacterium]